MSYPLKKKRSYSKKTTHQTFSFAMLKQKRGKNWKIQTFEYKFHGYVYQHLYKMFINDQPQHEKIYV